MSLETLSFLLFSQVLPIITVLAMVLIGSRFVFGIVARKVHNYSFTEEAVEKDNPAVLIRLAGLLFATLVAFIGIVKPTGLGLIHDLAVLGQAMFTVLTALWISMWVNDKWILHEFPNTYEVVSKRNSAVAIVEAGTAIATAMIFSGAFAGSENNFLTEIIWFVIGQAMLVGIAFLYRAVISDVAGHLSRQNTAVAFSMGGLLLASGLALGSAVSGPFVGWGVELMNVGLYMGAWLVVMISLRFVVNFIIVPGARLRHEIAVDGNWGVGLLDGALSVAFTIMFIRLANLAT